MLETSSFDALRRPPLLERVRTLLGDLLDVAHRSRPQWAQRAPTFQEGDVRLNVATLLVHAVAIDGRVTARERKALTRILEREYLLDSPTTEALIAAATKRENEVIDLYGLTSALRTGLSEDNRRRIVEILWEIAFADGEAHEFEDNMIWRVAELLGISPTERALLRKIIEARMAIS